MTERHILFSGAMVPPVLDDTKTQTRRALKQQPPAECGIHYMLGDESWMPEDKRTPLRHHWEAWGGPLYEQRPKGHLCGTHTVRCPYGAPGDRLVVRETFYAWGRWETRFNAKKGRDEWHFVNLTLESGRKYLYAADGENLTSSLGANQGRGLYPSWWKRPAIHMPRHASRITLEITAVRVEHLQDISEADAKAEGIFRHVRGGWHWLEHDSSNLDDWNQFGYKTPRDAYFALWESINGPGSWEANPWVWAVEFRRLP